MSDVSTPPRTRVLAAVGRGEATPNVVAHAAREAVARSCALELLHVIPADLPLAERATHKKGSLQAIGAATLEGAAQLAAGTAPEVPVVLTLASGQRAEALLNRTEDAALVVVGAPRGNAVAAGMWPGSLVTAIAMAAPCPVAVVPGDQQGEFSVHEVRVGLKWPPHDDTQLLEEAFAAAERWDCDLEVVHASRPLPMAGSLMAPYRPDPGWVPGLTALIEERLAPVRRSHPRVRVRVDVLRSTSTEALVEAARPGAMVMLSRTSGWAHGRMLGPTTRGLLQHARCPVEIVPIPGTSMLVGPRRGHAAAALRTVG
jgi:nucleotide-binding universal stress UspA family protein